MRPSGNRRTWEYPLPAPCLAGSRGSGLVFPRASGGRRCARDRVCAPDVSISGLQATTLSSRRWTIQRGLYHPTSRQALLAVSALPCCAVTHRRDHPEPCPDPCPLRPPYPARPSASDDDGRRVSGRREIRGQRRQRSRGTRLWRRRKGAGLARVVHPSSFNARPMAAKSSRQGKDSFVLLVAQEGVLARRGVTVHIRVAPSHRPCCRHFFFLVGGRFRQVHHP